MKLKIKSEFSTEITTKRLFKNEIEFNFEEYIKNNYLEDEIHSKYDLEDIISDIGYNIMWAYPRCEIFGEYEGDIVDESEIVNILNIDELVEQYSYLIIPIKENDCCIANRGFNYCSECGTYIGNRK